MIKTVGLRKQFGDFQAVKNLDLNVRDGEIYGFLGPNGAGKTTTILMILSILKPTGGDIYLFGEPLNRSKTDIRRKIGVVSERQFLYPEMTMQEYLDFFGELYAVADRRGRIQDLAGKVDLTDALNKRLGTFSRGMQQKVGFVRALLHDPDLLILDEPVSGLDPMGIRQIRELIADENRRGKTVLISSHLLSETEKLCDRVAVMNNGRLLAEDRMKNLVRRLTEEIELEIELAEGTAPPMEALKRLDYINEASVGGKLVTVKMKSDRDYRPDVVRVLISGGYIPVGIREKSMSLEDAFVTITKDNISLLAKAEAE